MIDVAFKKHLEGIRPSLTGIAGVGCFLAVLLVFSQPIMLAIAAGIGGLIFGGMLFSGTLRKTISGLVAVGVFVFLLVGTSVGLFTAVLGGIGGLIASKLVFRKTRKIGRPTEQAFTVKAEIVPDSEETKTLRSARNKQRDFENEAFKIPNPTFRAKVDAIADVIRRILDDLEEDPTDIPKARQFLNYYLDATLNVVKRYAQLSEKASGDPEIRESLEKVENTLDTIKDAFEKQLRILLEHDKMDLDTELTVLRRTIEMEGLGKDPFTRK